MSARRTVLTLMLVATTALLAAQDEQDPTADGSALAALVGQYIEQYYARAHHLLVDEQVILQPLTTSMAFAGLPRRLQYELRVEWDPSASDEDGGPARIVRRQLGAGGSRIGPPGQECYDPKIASPEPLAFLLPEQQETLQFRTSGPGQIDDRDVVRLDYRPREVQPATVDWEGQCGHVSLGGRMRGHLWVDPATGEILRWDEHLIGIVDIPGRDHAGRFDPRYWLTIERVDTTTRYEPVRFENPDEVLLLPALMENTTIIRNSGLPRLRTTRSFHNYRRFLTDSRLITSVD